MGFWMRLFGRRTGDRQEKKLSVAVAEADAAQRETRLALREWRARRDALIRQHGISWEELLPIERENQHERG